MISFVRGKLASIKADSVIVDIKGVGYQVAVPLSVISSLPPVGKEIILHTHLVVREDRMLLFGFRREEELDLFLELITVSRIGPKVALSLLSVLQPSELVTAVVKGNVGILTKVPGVGNKTAQRIILELKDKLKNKTFAQIPPSALDTEGQAFDEALEALTTLGYGQTEAMGVLQEVKGATGNDNPSAEELIRASLKRLSRS